MLRPCRPIPRPRIDIAPKRDVIPGERRSAAREGDLARACHLKAHEIPLTLAALLLLPLPAFAAHDYDDLPPDLARAAYAFDAAQVQGDGKALKAPVHIVWEQGAVLGGEVDYRYRMKGKPGGAYFRFADIWARRHGRWQVVYTEVTRIPRPR